MNLTWNSPSLQVTVVLERRRVSCEVARGVGRQLSSRLGPEGADSLPSSIANQRHDWGKSPDPSWAQPQGLQHRGRLCSGLTWETSQSQGVVFHLLAGNKQADIPAQGQCRQQAVIKDTTDEVSKHQAGCWVCSGTRRSMAMPPTPVQVTQAEWEWKLSSVVNTCAANSEEVTWAIWHYACNRSDFTTKQKFQVETTTICEQSLLTSFNGKRTHETGRCSFLIETLPEIYCFPHWCFIPKEEHIFKELRELIF